MECATGEWSVQLTNGVCNWPVECASGPWSVQLANGVCNWRMECATDQWSVQLANGLCQPANRVCHGIIDKTNVALSVVNSTSSVLVINGKKSEILVKVLKLFAQFFCYISETKLRFSNP